MSSFKRLSTSEMEQDSQFDYWRSFFLGAYLDRPRAAASERFQGRFLGGGSADSVIYHNLQADALTSHFGTRDSGLVLLGFIRSGQVSVTHGDDRREVLDSASGLILFDCDRPITTGSSKHDMCYISLPRSAVMAALGRDPNGSRAPLLRLPFSGFAAVLRAHMDEIARRGETMSEPQAVAALQAASALAIATLGELQDTNATEPQILDQARYEAACRQIELNAYDPTLTADRIAAQLNYSRAYLYRLFSGRGQTVAGHLRETRLTRAFSMLERNPAMPVSLVAFHCGYADLSAFGKAFKRRFGIAPSEMRRGPAAAG